jgi:glycosyltransferase involved in cell wall biosynthesis
VLQLTGSFHYDLVWIEKELFPFLPAWGERMLRLLKTPYAVDYDDAVFHTYDTHPSALVRRLLVKKIDHVMQHAALVTAGNYYLVERARSAGAARVEYLPTVIDLDRYPTPTAAPRDASEPVTIGWIGSPSTVRYLERVASVLRRIAGEMNVRIVVVGAKAGALPNGLAEYKEWSEDTEVAQVTRFDIGIMPLEDSPWERGKCGYKLIQYMACGKPVVASPVGINKDIVVHGGNGFLATSQAEWEHYLKVLVSDAGMRREMGSLGRRIVEERYCIQKTAPMLAAWLTQCTARNTTPRERSEAS